MLGSWQFVKLGSKMANRLREICVARRLMLLVMVGLFVQAPILQSPARAGGSSDVISSFPVTDSNSGALLSTMSVSGRARQAETRWWSTLIFPA